ncbi:hypothetical protein [Rhodococcus opacus]|uniref:hypothetical protein n=1 Tax=Rhodococcus opacus TaxID=37919 RepID=UPI0022364AE7|nr:hypothetical protein [Rhodococcus opacus]UZG55653.1 hypothetical protein ONE62_37590 [Rhodococcus opacus]
MTSNLGPDDDHWRDEALKRMNKASNVFHQVESYDPYPVEPGSDLDGDRVQIPVLFVDTLATRRLKVAVDYLTGLRELLNAGTHFYAPFALLRASLESGATAVCCWNRRPKDPTATTRRSAYR